jgi:predicted ribosomally synthesized peptide with SipW-like signal peptide
MKRSILMSLLVIGAVAAVIGGATLAVFNDTETSTGNTFAGGTLDLEYDINGGEWMNGDDGVAITVDNMKPSDKGEVTMSFHNAGSLDGDLTVTLNNVVDLDNGQNEPELAAGDDSSSVGELSSQLGIVVWIDDGDNLLEEGETALYDGKLDAIPGGELEVDMGVLEPSVPKYLAIAWHLQDEEGDLNNLVQSDSVSFDLTFDLVQS